MVAKIINKNADKILVVGPIYDRIDKLKKIQELCDDYSHVIFNGSLCYPYDDISEVESRIKEMNELLHSHKIIYNASNYDWLCARHLYDNNLRTSVLKWIQSKSNVVMINFKNQTNLIITSGGVIPSMNREIILNNLETSFVSNFGEVPWHKRYTGLMGYVISNNPLTFQKPKFYPYSAQIGNIYSPKVQIYAQEIEPYGLKRTILL